MDRLDAEDPARRLKELAAWADHIVASLGEVEGRERACEQARALRRTLLGLAADLHLARAV